MNFVPPYNNYGMYNKYKPTQDEGFDNQSTCSCNKDYGNMSDGYSGYGYGNSMNTTKTMGCPTYQNCQQTVQSCNIEEIPHYINYHTHNIYNVVKRHINIPTCSQSQEVRVFNEYMPMCSNYGQGSPYQGPMGLNNFFVPFPNL